MSDELPPTNVPSDGTDLPPAAEPVALRREALLPSERNRGLGTVAVVCTMAGVASGLALATTLMAMQVADTMTMRSSCAYRQQLELSDLRADHGFLGIRWGEHDTKVTVDAVLPGTPADAVGLRVGDQLIAVDGQRVHNGRELRSLIYTAPPGAHPTILIRRAGQLETFRPTLTSWPNLSY